MKIDSAVNPTDLKLPDLKPSTEDILKLLDGVKIKATVVSVGTDEITLKMPNGQLIKGRPEQNSSNSLIKPDENLEFNVRVADNKILFMPLNRQMQNKTAGLESSAGDFLKNANLPVNEKNLALINNLIDNNLPVTKENIFKLNQNINLTDNLKQAIFLLKNSIKPTKANLEIIKGLTEHENVFSNALSNVFDGIEALDDPVLKEKLVNIFNHGENAPEDINTSQTDLKQKNIFEKEEIFEIQKKNLQSKEIITEAKEFVQTNARDSKDNILSRNKNAFDILNSENIDLDEFLEHIRQGIGQAKQMISENKSENTTTLEKSLIKLKDTLDFFANAKENIFIQIPILIENKKFNSEIYVFNENKQKKINGGNCTALVSLETVSLGRFEAFIKKTDRQINFEFNLKSTEAEDLVRNNIGLLESALKEKGYALSGFGFKKTHDDFDITENTKESVSKFVSFDFRA